MSRLYITVIILAFSSIAAGSRILGIFPYPAYSHQVVFRAYTLELLKRGHELVVFTTYPMKDPKLANYTEIDLSVINNEWKNSIDFFQIGKQENVWSFVRLVTHFGEVISESVLSHPAMQEIIATNSTQKFDVILMQHLFYDALYALSIHLNIPMIGVSSLELLTLHRFHFGNEMIMSYGRSLLGGKVIDNLLDRIYEAYHSLRVIYMYKYLNLPIQEKILRKHFGDTMPPIEKLSNQIEILLVSRHPYFNEPHSHVPAIIYIGRCRFVGLSGNTTMSEDLKEILDKATSGFIYFSMGSNVKISHLPMKVRNAILATFAELPYTVIWKSEIAVDNKPNNVIIRNWLPQQEILAHPNIVLYIYQGGLQSTEEAIEYAVPVLGMPVFADQNTNINLLVQYGVAKSLELSHLTKETFKQAVTELITNQKYKEKVTKLRDLFRDLPYQPLEYATWWIEHVIRHKGAKHLRSESRDMELWKLQHLDILAVFLASCVLLICVTLLIVWYVCRKIMQYMKRNEVKPSKKTD